MVYHGTSGQDPQPAQTNIFQTERYENKQSVNFHEVKDLTLWKKSQQKRYVDYIDPCQNWVITLILLLDSGQDCNYI